MLYESYFVCITISGEATLIEYGKSVDTKDRGIVYLNMIDRSRNFDIRFYAFGNKDEPANIMDAHVVSHKRTEVTCKGQGTVKDAIENLCAKNCHKHCNPVAGQCYHLVSKITPKWEFEDHMFFCLNKFKKEMFAIVAWFSFARGKQFATALALYRFFS